MNFVKSFFLHLLRWSYEFFSFIPLTKWIALIFKMLNQSNIPQENHIWSSIVGINLLVFCWRLYTNVNEVYQPGVFFSCNVCVWFQFSSVAQSCPTLRDPVDHSMPGLPVHHQLPESTQTHLHWVTDAIQPSHPLLSPSPSAFNLSQHQGLFKWVSSLHQVAKVLEFQLQHQSFQWTLRTDLLQNGLVGSPCSPRDSQEPSPTPQFKSINSLALSLLHSPTLTSIHDYWKNHSFDYTDLC